MANFNNSLNKLQNWIEQKNYKGYEPFDALFSFLRPLTFGKPFAERLLIQAVRQRPINLRPLIGVKPHESAKGRAYMAAGYLCMFKHSGTPQFRQKAIDCLSWLMQNRSPGYPDYCWGNQFDWTNREGRLPKFEPTIVWTGIIGQTFLDAYELLRDETYLDVAKSICHWIAALPREETDAGHCLSYVAFEQSSIHNSNLIGAAMLARTAHFTQNDLFLWIAKQAANYSCAHQLESGAWYYGEAPMHHWIDNFHTCFNLDSLKCTIDYTNDIALEKNVKAGFEYLLNTFFEENGRPKYYHNRTYPVDIQCASQAIDTLANFAEEENRALPMAVKVANWTIAHMQDKSGYFYYRQLPWTRVKIPMLHWGQATMYKALAHLISKMPSEITAELDSVMQKADMT